MERSEAFMGRADEVEVNESADAEMPLEPLGIFIIVAHPIYSMKDYMIMKYAYV